MTPPAAPLPVRRVAVLPNGREHVLSGRLFYVSVRPVAGPSVFHWKQWRTYDFAGIFYTTNTGREIVVKALYR